MFIDLNKRQMVFEVDYFKVTTLLDPTEGKRYVEPKKRKEIDNSYNMIVQMDDYVNPTTKGIFNWRITNSCALDSEYSLENWQ
jgi:secreted protein with Ig-like and vWFA domain